MKKNPDCLACEKYGPPRWNPVTRRIDHVIPYRVKDHPSVPDFGIECPASVIDGRWKHGKRQDR